MIKGIIFDFDGTLFDSMEIWNHIAYDYLKIKGIEDLSVTKNVSNMSMNDALVYMKEEYQIQDHISIMYQDVLRLLYDYYAYEIKPREGVIDFLDYLHNKHIKLFILSASTRNLIEVALSHYSMQDYFDEILCCDELQLSKNESEIFLKTLKKMNLSINEVIIFEDAYNAIQSAKSAGFKVVGVYDKNETKDISLLVDLYIRDYYEMEVYKE